MARVELRVYPPLSRRVSSKTAGALILEQAVETGETLGELLTRLEGDDHEGWRNIWDSQSGQLQPAIMVFLSGRVLPRSDVAQAPLADGDEISIRMVIGAG